MVPGNAGKRIPLMFKRDIELRALAEISELNVVEAMAVIKPCRLRHLRAGVHARQAKHSPTRRFSSSAWPSRCPSTDVRQLRRRCATNS
jgi:hypothetical protein